MILWTAAHQAPLSMGFPRQEYRGGLPTVLLKVLYCKIKKIFFNFLLVFFFMHYLCEKYDKPITVQYYIADSISWVPKG